MVFTTQTNIVNPNFEILTLVTVFDSLKIGFPNTYIVDFDFFINADETGATFIFLAKKIYMYRSEVQWPSFAQESIIQIDLSQELKKWEYPLFDDTELVQIECRRIKDDEYNFYIGPDNTPIV